MIAKLDRPGGPLHLDVIDAVPPWAGEAPPVVFRHDWLPSLVDRYRIARFDTLGFGRSTVPGPGHACGRALRALLDRRIGPAA